MAGRGGEKQARSANAARRLLVGVGVEPLLTHEIYINYADDTMTIGPSVN